MPPPPISSQSFPHFIFGYGSLICPTSRAVTAPSLRGRYATPVCVQNLERMWSFPVPECGMTFMGVRVATGKGCVGVLVPVNDDELAQFDVRELGYDRVLVSPSDISKIDLEPLEPNEQQEEKQEHPDAESFFPSDKNQKIASPRSTVWVYIQQAPSPIQHDCPLAQTYIDIILRGCLTISPDFAVQVLKTTRGWHALDFESNDCIEDEKTAATSGVPGGSAPLAKAIFWVDDRHDPIYSRADAQYSKQHGSQLDQLLAQYRPELEHRKPYYRRSKTV